MVVAHLSDAAFDGGSKWLDILVPFVEFVAEKANSFSLKVPAVTLKNVHLKEEVSFLEFTGMQE